MRKLKWGMVGGGKGSQIGPIHRMSTAIDNNYELCAAALDADPLKGKDFAIELRVDPNRAYGSWQEMLEKEKLRTDKLDLVTIATPNSTHYEISKAFLNEGFNVFCEKPLCLNLKEGAELAQIAKHKKLICAVNYGYTGYPMIRQIRSMVQNGVIGKVRMMFAEFAHGHHAANASQNHRIRWRYDPKLAGISAVFADTGIHAAHLCTFIINDDIQELSSHTVSCIENRKLEDDAMVNFVTKNGTVGRLWASSIALGRQHGLTIQIFGELGGISWKQEHPEQIYYTPIGKRTEIIERGEETLCKDAQDSTFAALGHPEGMIRAFANLYVDIAKAIHDPTINKSSCLYPNATDGTKSIAMIEAVVNSAKNGSAWTKLKY